MKNSKRILKVVVKRMVDTDSDTSYLGHYSNRPESGYAIDRASNEFIGEQERGLELLSRIENYLAKEWEEIAIEDNASISDEWAIALDKAQNLIRDIIEEWETNLNWNHREYRYFNGPIENYKGESPEDIRKYVRQDYERMESLNRGDWWYIGIRAEIAIEGAEPSRRYHFEGWDIQTIVSGGLWGIESDSGKSYLQSIAKEELANLRQQLKALGFSTRAISRAFKNVQEVSV